MKSHHQIYSNVSKAKPSQLCNRCLFHITSCKRSFTSAFKCVITSVPSAEQQSVLRKFSTSFLPCLLFLFGERSESVRNPSDRHTQTPQKPERVDESRTQAHRNQTAWTVDRSGYCSQKKSTTQGKFIVLSIYFRRVRRAGAPPLPHLGKKFRSGGEKLSSAQICRQKRMRVPLRYNKIKTKKVRKKEEKSKRKGIKEVKKEDSRSSEIEIIK